MYFRKPKLLPSATNGNNKTRNICLSTDPNRTKLLSNISYVQRQGSIFCLVILVEILPPKGSGQILPIGSGAKSFRRVQQLKSFVV